MVLHEVAYRSLGLSEGEVDGRERYELGEILLQPLFMALIYPVVAIVVPAGLFALLHNQTLGMLLVLVDGLFLGYARWRSGSFVLTDCSPPRLGEQRRSRAAPPVVRLVVGRPVSPGRPLVPPSSRPPSILSSGMPAPTPSSLAAPRPIDLGRPRHALGLLVLGSVGYGVLVLALVYAGALAPGVTLTREVVILSLSRGLEWIVAGPILLFLYRRIQSPRLAGLPRVVAYLLAAIALHSVTELGHTAFAQGVIGYGDQLPFSEFYWSSWRNNVLIHNVLYMGLVGAVYGYDRHMESLRIMEAYRAREVREAHLESELAQAQLQALRMQLNPHFLFNALSAVAALTKRDPSRARGIVVDLGELLRLSLDTTEEEVPLREELTLLDRYLRIEQARMGDRLRVDVRVDEDTLEALVPPLLLQPLVENAVKHGVAPLEAGGSVEVRAVREGGRLVLTVRDTGPGLVPSSAAGERRGIGLTNVRRRLDRLHGDAASLSIESPPFGGFTATAALPFTSAYASADLPTVLLSE